MCVYAGTGLDWQSCPAGTYSDQEGLSADTQCKPCPGGTYCDGQHNTNYTGLCQPGIPPHQPIVINVDQ